MTTISAEDRAEAQAMADAFYGRQLSALNDRGVSRWLAARDCVLASHTCQPVWRPTTAAEIQPGWEIRARHPDGAEATWGTAHFRDNAGNWRAEKHRLLTWDAAGWTYETTAPLPAPTPDPRIQVVVEWFNEPSAAEDRDAALDLLARLDSLKEES